MLFLAAGVRRSASTLVFQLACELAGGDSRCIRRWRDAPNYVCGSDVWWVAKSHNYLPELFRDMQDGSAKALVTIRDPRDIAVSMMQLKSMTFDEVMKWNVIPRGIHQQMLWANNHSECIVLRYEDFVDDISLLAWVISGMLELEVNEELINALATTYSFEQNKARSDKIGKVETDLLFPGHLQTGEVGIWKRELTQAQANEIRQVIGNGWFQRWGYK